MWSVDAIDIVKQTSLLLTTLLTTATTLLLATATTLLLATTQVSRLPGLTTTTATTLSTGCSSTREC